MEHLAVICFFSVRSRAHFRVLPPALCRLLWSFFSSASILLRFRCLSRSPLMFTLRPSLLHERRVISEVFCVSLFFPCSLEAMVSALLAYLPTSRRGQASWKAAFLFQRPTILDYLALSLPSFFYNQHGTSAGYLSLFGPPCLEIEKNSSHSGIFEIKLARI